MIRTLLLFGLCFSLMGQGKQPSVEDTIMQLEREWSAADIAKDAATLDRLEQQSQVAFRYCTADGTLDAAANPNGSRNDIAGIFSNKRNVLGLMPHPERAVEPEINPKDCTPSNMIFQSLIATIGARK